MSYEPPEEPEPLPYADEPPEVLPAPLPPPPPGPHLGWALLWFLGFFAFQLVIGVGLGVVLVLLAFIRGGKGAFANGAESIMQQEGGMLILFMGATAGNVLFAIVVTAVMFKGRFRTALALRSFHPLHWLMVILLAPPFLLVAAEIGTWAMEVLPHFNFNTESYAELAKSAWVFVFLGGCIFPGVGEEILFRGFLGRGLLARHGLALGLIASSVLFGLAHLDPPQVVATAVLGFGFHLVFLSTKSLIAPMLAHTLNNGLAFTIMKSSAKAKEVADDAKVDVAQKAEQALEVARENAGLAALLADEKHLPVDVALAAVAATATLLLFFYYTRARWWLPDGTVWNPGYLTAEMPPAELQAQARISVPPLWTICLAIAGYGTFVIVIATRLLGG